MTNVKTAIINRGIIENAYTYEEYIELIKNLLDKNKTTGENHSEALLHYTNMNIHRMQRLDKQIELKEGLVQRLNSMGRSMIWLVLTEGWSGDAAQIIPVIQKMADQTKKIQTRYLLRDENLDIIEPFLTDGDSRFIPKLICLDAKTLNILGEWGPRPSEAQQLHKALSSRDYSARNVAERIHNWYSEDKTRSVQDEFFPLIEEWARRD